MTRVNIISGFLGAGKTTLIKKLLNGAFPGEKVVLLENEYGEVGIDGGFMKDAGIQVTELNSGCICCTLVGDFSNALDQLIEQFHPDRILIEPSGVGKLSDIRGIVHQAEERLDLRMSGCATVADVNKCKMYARNFGEFFLDQIESAETIILSRTQTASPEKIESSIAAIREHNPQARIITTPWDELTPSLILKTMESPEYLLDAEEFAKHLHHHHEHHHDHDDHDEHEHCCHGEHHHDHDDHDEHEHCCHGEHHHDHDDHDKHEHCCHGEHHHDHDDHDEHEHCCHGEHHHDHDEHEHCCHGEHHHDHDADEVFENIGVETAKRFEKAALENALKQLEDEEKFGAVLRAKGILPLTNGGWLQFDYVPGEYEIRESSPDYTGRLCVIGAELHEDAIKELFGL